MRGLKLGRSQTQYQRVTLLACLALPFLVPFTIEKNINLQALILVATGAIAWFGVWQKRHNRSDKLQKPALITVTVYLGSCLLSLAFHPSLNNLVGTHLIRLGTLELIACIGCGLLLRAVDAKRLIGWIYLTSVGLAVITIPYRLANRDSFSRLDGVFHQSDILAVWMAVGVVLGIALWRFYPRWKTYLVVSQLGLTTILVLTQTRAVLGVLVFVLVTMIEFRQKSIKKRLLFTSAVAAVLILAILAFQSVMPHRFTNLWLAGQNTSYRLTLQKYGIRAAEKQPLTGYGAGSIPAALACPTLHSPALQLTCQQGYYFDSSHNIFLDRFITLGMIGGLAFATFVLYALYQGLEHKDIEQYFTFCALVISLYYFTNVTSLSVELLFWIFLFRSLPLLRRKKANRA